MRHGDDLRDKIQQLEMKAANLRVCLEHMNSETQKASKRQHPHSSSEPAAKARTTSHGKSHGIRVMSDLYGKGMVRSHVAEGTWPPGNS